MTYIKYSLDFLRPITSAGAFEADNWLADLPKRTWPQAAGRSSDVILLKSIAAILTAAMFCWGLYDGFNFAGWRGKMFLSPVYEETPKFCNDPILACDG